MWKLRVHGDPGKPTGWELSILGETLAICRLPKGSAIPPWSAAGGLFLIAKTQEELSVICPQEHVPKGAEAQRGWRALRVKGPLDFSLAGVLASLAAPLAEAGIPMLAFSTYSTDYILVRECELAAAINALRRAGHTIKECSHH